MDDLIGNQHPTFLQCKALQSVSNLAEVFPESGEDPALTSEAADIVAVEAGGGSGDGGTVAICLAFGACWDFALPVNAGLGQNGAVG